MRNPPKSSQTRFASYLPYKLLDRNDQNYAHQELTVKFPCSRKHPRCPALSQPEGQNEGADVEVAGELGDVSGSHVVVDDKGTSRQDTPAILPSQDANPWCHSL